MLFTPGKYCLEGFLLYHMMQLTDHFHMTTPSKRTPRKITCRRFTKPSTSNCTKQHNHPHNTTALARKPLTSNPMMWGPIVPLTTAVEPPIKGSLTSLRNTIHVPKSLLPYSATLYTSKRGRLSKRDKMAGPKVSFHHLRVPVLLLVNTMDIRHRPQGCSTLHSASPPGYTA